MIEFDIFKFWTVWWYDGYWNLGEETGPPW